MLTRVLKRIEEDVRYHSELFDEPTSEAICAMLAPQMAAFGYTAVGIDDEWTPERFDAPVTRRW